MTGNGAAKTVETQQAACPWSQPCTPQGVKFVQGAAVPKFSNLDLPDDARVTERHRQSLRRLIALRLACGSLESQLRRAVFTQNA
jgi:hypothetical protein